MCLLDDKKGKVEFPNSNQKLIMYHHQVFWKIENFLEMLFNRRYLGHLAVKHPIDNSLLIYNKLDSILRRQDYFPITRYIRMYYYEVHKGVIHFITLL